METVTLTIDGMHCGHCVAAVKRAIEEVPGAELRDVGIGRATVDVTGPEQIDAVRTAVEDAGYVAEVSPS